MTTVFIITATVLNAALCAIVCLRLARRRTVEVAAPVPVITTPTSIVAADDHALTPTQQLYAQYIASAAMDEALHPPAVSEAPVQQPKPKMPSDKEIAAMIRAVSKIKMTKDTAAILAIAGFAGLLGVGVGYIALNSQHTREKR